MNFKNLESLSREDLVDLAIKQGLPKPHHKAKPETIIKQIVDKAVSPQQPQEMQHPASAPAKPVHVNTPEDVERVVAEFKKRTPHFETHYTDADGNKSDDPTNWHFVWRSTTGRVGREESGNLSIPLRVIRDKAHYISQGPLALLGLNQHFDATVATGNSAYTNNVLA